MLRQISVFLRKRRAKQAALKELNQFETYQTQIGQLPLSQPNKKTLLLIRLDDIGDYILFRNTLIFYKTSPRWKEYTIILLGNSIWKDLYEAKDAGCAEGAIWIDKQQYLKNDEYKWEVWKQVRKNGYEVVVCPSRTRPLLLDDLCALATGAPVKIAAGNMAPHPFQKQVSDGIYSDLFTSSQPFVHEFWFNQHFANWCCGTNHHLERPVISYQSSHSQPYILCFIGASTGSKRWPNNRWIALIKQWKQDYQIPVLIAGGKAEAADATFIITGCKAENISGRHSLPNMIDVIGNATVIISNDTMAAHAGVACNKPTLIIANGNQDHRFTNYNEAQIDNVWTFYPVRFLRKQRKHPEKKYEKLVVVTADIASIQAEKVYSVLADVMNKQLSFQPSV